jgi:hypothetical protein
MNEGLRRIAGVAGLSACSFCAAALAAVPAIDQPQSVRALIDAGTPQLALMRIEALQSADPGAPRWAEWEAMRCEVLARLGRTDALLARAASLPSERTPLPNVCLLEAARAAVIQNEGPLARTHAAQLLWQSKPTIAEIQSARLAVIESYIVERRGEEAYRSMLRFQQDYQPLDPATSRRFAEALLDVGREREALNWIGASGESTPTRLRLQLRSAGLTPEAVIAQARAAYAKTRDPAFWRVVLEASARKKNAAAEVEAREHLLQHAPPREDAKLAEAARELLRAYLAAANDAGNREGLLLGDDAAWADYAARRVASDPALSRAFYAYLAQRAQSADMRRNAQLALAFSLSQAQLDYTALHLMRELGVELDKLDPQTRYLLGTIAAKRSEHALALELWQGLETPANTKAEDWQLMLARTTLRAGSTAAFMDAVRRLLDGPDRPGTETMQGAFDLAQETLELRKLPEAQALYERLARRASGNDLRRALSGLGRVHDLKGEPHAAADAYLRSALLAATADANAVQARLLAAANLARAGYKDDARTQFEWVIKHSKDQALADDARRALARL